jgi:hypothetical protein
VRGAARAIGWEFGRRHRLGLIALGAYLLVFWAIRLLVLGPAHPITLDPPNGLAAFIVVPVTITVFYFVGVFSFGLSGDLAARQSIYPSRMFTLPVTSAALAGWPMLYGTAAMASVWIGTVLFTRWIGAVDLDLPLIWPAVLSAAYLAWTQALSWMPYGLPGLRVIVATLWLAVVDTIVLLAIHYKASELRMIAILAPQIPIAYAVACYAVARARRGDVPDWRVSVRSSTTTSATSGFGGIGPFRSASRAQTWFEWRRHGRTLPAMVAIVVPVELLLLFVPGNDTAPIVFLTLCVAAFTPPFLAAFAAAALSAATTYTATRPLTTVGLIAAKLRMTIWSTLAAWLLVIIFIPAALLLSGRMPVVVERTHAMIDVTGISRGIAVVLLVAAALIASTWKNLVQSLSVGLTGRGWLIRSSVLLALAALVAAWPLADAVLRNRQVQSFVWDYLPWILVALCCIKVVAAACVAIRLYDSRLLSGRVLVTGAVCWFVAVAALYGGLEWLAASPAFPRYLLGATAILEVPLVRVSAAPLALAWSRHR